MRKLVLTLLVIASTHTAARAESLGLGIFVGEPLGLDIKIDLQRRSAIDVVIGATTIDDGRQSYAHLTYLYTLAVLRGDSVRVPLRLGLGGAIYGVTEDNAGLAARVPFELGLRFRRSPLEIYFELSFVLQLLRQGNGDGDDIDADLDGGIGLRLYF